MVQSQKGFHLGSNLPKKVSNHYPEKDPPNEKMFFTFWDLSKSNNFLTFRNKIFPYFFLPHFFCNLFVCATCLLLPFDFFSIFSFVLVGLSQLIRTKVLAFVLQNLIHYFDYFFSISHLKTLDPLFSSLLLFFPFKWLLEDSLVQSLLHSASYKFWVQESLK